MKKYNHALSSYEYNLDDCGYAYAIDISGSIFSNRRFFINQMQFNYKYDKTYSINLFALNYFKADKRDFLRVKK